MLITATIPRRRCYCAPHTVLVIMATCFACLLLINIPSDDPSSHDTHGRQGEQGPDAEVKAGGKDAGSSQWKRKQRIKEVCETMYHGNHGQIEADLRLAKLDNILVDDKRKLLFCLVPKVACTNWLRTLAMTSDTILVDRLRQLWVHPNISMLNLKPDTTWPSHLKRRYIQDIDRILLHTPDFYYAAGLTPLSEFPTKGIQHRIKNYYKFMFVRHPLERILSAFKDKFESGLDPPFHKVVGTFIIRTIRKNATSQAKAKGDDVSFEEFVRFIVKRDNRSAVHNTHWNQYHRLCMPCALNYDFIGKFETLQQDADEVMSRLTDVNSPFTSLLPAHYGPTSYDGQSTSKQLKRYLRKFPTELLYQLRSVYDLDFLLFDYNNFPG